MGNLKQENHFSTEGDGLAQWTGARLQNLKQRANYQSLEAQIQYLVDELNTTEKRAGDAVKASQSVEESTLAFQNSFERCGQCMESQRINYAHEMLQKFAGA